MTAPTEIHRDRRATDQKYRLRDTERALEYAAARLATLCGRIDRTPPLDARVTEFGQFELSEPARDGAWIRTQDIVEVVR